MSGAGLTYCMLYFTRGLPPINEGIHRVNSVEMFNVVRNQTTQNDVIIFRKPRVLSLLTSRKSSCYHTSENDEELLNYFKKIGAAYLIEDIDKDSYLSSFLKRNKNRFKHVFSNNDFSLYKIVIRNDVK